MAGTLQKRRQEIKTKLPELLDEVVYAIESVHPECAVILFGSYAKGNANETSDLDICVLVPELTRRREDMAVDAMCAIPVGFPLPYDLVLYTFAEFEQDKQNKYLLGHHISKDGVILNDKQRVGGFKF
jgi:predicted nucleotidyltransferase